ncbi:VOC family protein [Luteolibacter flavescens]|uniref:VOC family protein n=1 Tax=Luteolibacter flavescens TaxID=1859460 RepID=A0ABT3FQZ1_9BACT|nr:VOC family protein [Luteolibacter flavescens]MCW1885877.1 VOC family protein [Luteolibacter flavescens]
MSTSTIDNPAAAKSSVKPVPEGMHTITPHLVCAGAVAAMEFYKKAFGAIEIARLQGPDGRLMHGMIRIGDSALMLVDEMPECGAMAPVTLKGSPVSIHLQVEDADATFEQAVAAGAEVKMPLSNMFWGDRYGCLQDPFGHQWSVATHIEDLTPEQIQEAAKNACCGG